MAIRSTTLALFLLPSIPVMADIGADIALFDVKEGWFGDVPYVPFMHKTLPLKQGKFEYRPNAEKEGECAKIRVVVLVSPEGHAIDHKVIWAHPKGSAFEKAIADHILDTQFQRLIIDGKGVSYEMLLPFFEFKAKTGCKPLPGLPYVLFPTPKTISHDATDRP